MIPKGGQVSPKWAYGKWGSLPDGSGMSREAHVPFYEGLAGKFRRSTHQSLPGAE
ncbi:hypothetical protein [Endozoicomonas euniceicola]|uniref:Uncharacterized protein n=1 Tax=Endozoicomonas euniceicola TaxID=1234143 RepID=A0ABY6GU43_9GAMM|nr:hypothetical protein [Endozoicomonas euniceicola]UYM15571.1 hypothetical protein NX720_22455 [Endozoicomonas euniceicola]